MTDYALALSEAEIQRYRLMAERAEADEAELWRRAGIGPGAVVADVGCGPAAVSVVLARIMGPNGHVIGVEPDDSVRATAAQLVERAGAANVDLRPGTGTNTGLPPG